MIIEDDYDNNNNSNSNSNDDDDEYHDRKRSTYIGRVL
jgi:hypothetical protein